jgi:hypothetical protein
MRPLNSFTCPHSVRCWSAGLNTIASRRSVNLLRDRRRTRFDESEVLPNGLSSDTFSRARPVHPGPDRALTFAVIN